MTWLQNNTLTHLWKPFSRRREPDMQSDDPNLAVRLKVAEEAVKIVKKYNTNKWKDDKQRGMVELCTEIAEILDSKKT